MDDFELPEKAESQKERVIGLIIAGIAVVLAIVSAIAHETQNDEILANADANDQYAFFQAKKTRHEQLELSTDYLKLSEDRLSAGSQANGPPGSRASRGGSRRRAAIPTPVSPTATATPIAAETATPTYRVRTSSAGCWDGRAGPLQLPLQ